MEVFRGMNAPRAGKAIDDLSEFTLQDNVQGARTLGSNSCNIQPNSLPEKFIPSTLRDSKKSILLHFLFPTMIWLECCTLHECVNNTV